MKKIICALLCAVTSITSITSFTSLTVSAQTKDDCLAAVYVNGALTACAPALYDKGTLYSDINVPENAVLKAFFTDDGIVEITSKPLPYPKAEPTATPEIMTAPTATPEVTSKPEPTKAPTVTPEPTKKPRPTYHPAYETENDAVQAFAVVKSVNVVDADGESKYKIEAYNRGELMSYIVDSDKYIASAPAACANLAGEEVSSLKKGDVIVVTCGVSGNIRSIDVVMRPVKDDIITGGVDFGNSFEYLFANGDKTAGFRNYLKYGAKIPSDGEYYVFGAVREKNSNELVLINEGGKDKEAFYIDLAEKMIVYKCDVSDKFEVEVTTAAGIRRSDIPKADKDDDDNVVNWDASRKYTYALVRICDGTAPEAVVFEGFGE